MKNHSATAISDFVATRRAKTGRKYETCERMQPVFADLDAAGANVWPENWADLANAETRRQFGVVVRETSVGPETSVKAAASETSVTASPPAPILETSVKRRRSRAQYEAEFVVTKAALGSGGNVAGDLVPASAPMTEMVRTRHTAHRQV